MDYKRSYTRRDLTREVEGVFQVCIFCNNKSRDGGDVIAHDADCPLADENVMGVMVTTLSKPRVAICEQCPCGRGSDNCMAGDWRACVHETLVKCCGRYAYAVGRMT